jgi:hypothetical protein
MLYQVVPKTRKVIWPKHVKEHFPFAAVAERHKQAVQKVFDTFSAIVQLPLSICTADNQRHSRLKKQRLGEFRRRRRRCRRYSSRRIVLLGFLSSDSTDETLYFLNGIQFYVTRNLGVSIGYISCCFTLDISFGMEVKFVFEICLDSYSS